MELYKNLKGHQLSKVREGLFWIISEPYWAILKSLYNGKEIPVIPHF